MRPRVSVTRLVGKWKVSQNRATADRAGVVDNVEREDRTSAMEMTMARIVNSRCVLAVRDLVASTRYYTEVLGFTRDPIDGAGWSFLTRDTFSVMLGECANERPASELGDHSYFAYWIVDDVDGFYREIVDRGALVSSSGPTDKPWGMREFVLRTPDGHRITCGELLQR